MTKEQKFEWNNAIELKKDAKVSFVITQPIILNKELGKKRIAVMAYLLTRKGLDNKLDLSLNSIAKWYGRNPNRSETGINTKFAEIISNLKEEKYIDYSEKLKHEGNVEVEFNYDKYQKQLNDSSTRFAVIYLDEFRNIVEYANSKNKDIPVSDDTLLVVFAYLRMMIYRRRNILKSDEVNRDNKNSHDYDIKVRRMNAPEVYNSYYSDIANELGLTLQTFTLAINALKELDLIYVETLPRFKSVDENGEERWTTSQSLFCNTYHREGAYLLANGKNYYENEISNKKERLKKYWNKQEGSE